MSDKMVRVMIEYQFPLADLCTEDDLKDLGMTVKDMIMRCYDGGPADLIMNTLGDTDDMFNSLTAEIVEDQQR